METLSVKPRSNDNNISTQHVPTLFAQNLQAPAKRSQHLNATDRNIVEHKRLAILLQRNLVSRASFPLTSGRKTRALGATISGMRHRCRCAVSRITRIRLFPLFFHNGCSQSSRFPTAGQGERSSGNEIGCNALQVEIPTSAHAQAQHCCTNLAKRPQHHATS